MDEYFLTTEELCDKFHTNIHSGLTSEQVKERRSIDGYNTFGFVKKSKNISFYINVIFGGYKYFLWNNLLFCVIVHAIDLYKDTRQDENVVNLAAVLFFLIVLASLKSSFKRRIGSFMLERLRFLTERKVNVIRNGESSHVDIEQLVKGDIVELTQGDLIPADINLVDSKDLLINNVFLTGEIKKIQDDFKTNTIKSIFEIENVGLFSGLIKKGKTRGLVISTGDDTIMSKLAHFMLEGNESQRFMRNEISHTKYLIKVTGAVMAVVTYLVFNLAGKSGMEISMFLCGYNIASICLYLQLEEFKETTCKMK